MANNISETRQRWEHAYMLVGRFMSHWAHLENAVNDAVGSLLKMESLEATVATVNMQLRSKLHILKSMITLECPDTDWRKSALKDVEQVGNLADSWRNIVAHVSFGPIEDDGVKFLVVRAKGKLNFPNVERSEAEFLAVSSEMMRLSDRIKEIAASLVLKSKGLAALIAQAPSGTTPSQETRSYLGHLLQGTPDWSPPTSEESPQTPQEPEGK